MEPTGTGVIVNISNRHFHCTAATFEKLFGAGKKPTRMKDLLQPGQYACEETVTLRGPKGAIHRARLIAPFRSYDQVELSRTDCFTLGIDAPVRDSGNVKGSAPITLEGPAGTVNLSEGAIVQARHIHLHPSEAARLGVKNMEYVYVKVAAGTPREAVYRTLIRVREDMSMECHLDTDEGNAAGVKNGEKGELLK